MPRDEKRIANPLAPRRCATCGRVSYDVIELPGGALRCYNGIGCQAPNKIVRRGIA